ncbi:MAG TPA: chromosomal replication initiator protein DnaA [Tepidisphaeraceae bacterium]|nr:chromosomal replication initiator protein DnaA [Tepidisphaeraceae bacterium]
MNRLILDEPAVTGSPLTRLHDVLQAKIGTQRYEVWFSRSAKFDLRNDWLEINVPNDFICEWIGTHFSRPIQEATHEVFGSSMPVKFNVVPQLFEGRTDLVGAGPPVSTGPSALHKPKAIAPVPGLVNGLAGRLPVQAQIKSKSNGNGATTQTKSITPPPTADRRPQTNDPSGPIIGEPATAAVAKARLRHDLTKYVVGVSNQLAHNTMNYVCEFPGGQYNPLFIYGTCGLGKTHLLQGLCRKFAEAHPTRRWMYLTGEEFTNEYVTSLRQNRVDQFRRKMRDLDLLVIDDVHFLAGKRSTQEEFLHTFNAIEATGRQVVMASDAHPKHIQEFSESLINRFISGMVVRIDPPNFSMRCDILQRIALERRINVSNEVIDWIAKRVTQNVRELEGALTRVQALSRLDSKSPGIDTVALALGDIDRQMVAPLKPENILISVCHYFGLDNKELMSGRRQRTISLARSVAMFLVRKNSRLSFPEIAAKLGKRNHSTVISACRRIERALSRNEKLAWESSIGDRCDEAQELIQRLEESARAMA